MQTLSISKNVLRDFLFFFNEKKAPFDKKKLKNKNINKQIKHKTLIKKTNFTFMSNQNICFK